ncbi:hypothetical protein VTK73DRAFT_5688 [Phialemonium thermophilum]|uniref:Uncharacterized protein n=1 Tax=Phialemonium thermophilum TaxID=223376 RepID=A0ABR3WM56_9PEZI
MARFSPISSVRADKQRISREVSSALSHLSPASRNMSASCFQWPSFGGSRGQAPRGMPIVAGQQSATVEGFIVFRSTPDPEALFAT